MTQTIDLSQIAPPDVVETLDFETIYQAARFEPQVADGIGEPLLELFDRCRAPDTGAGALYQGCCALILPLVKDDVAQGLHLRPPRFGLFGPFEAGEHG